jgi:hypothetical protein
VLFSSSDRLLDSDPGGPGYGLYLYTDSANPETDSNLTFIERTEGKPVVIGMSTDAKRIYFVTDGDRLDVWDEGVTRKVTDRFRILTQGSYVTLPEKGAPGTHDGAFNVWLESLQAATSSDGQHIAFVGLTESGPLLAGKAVPGWHDEMYLYDAPAQTLKCVSCPSKGGFVKFSIEPDPEATEFAVELSLGFPHRFMSADGRYVFFSTREALVPQDSNGLTDTYEYSVETGEVGLVTSGSGGFGAWFVEASANGSDVFFVTQQSYSRWDKDNLVDLYDARVNGGLPEPPVPVVPCAGDACQGTPSAVPSFNTASGFSGLGNTAPRAVSKPKKKGKPPKHHAKKRKKKRAHRRAKAKRAGRHVSRRAGR